MKVSYSGIKDNKRHDGIIECEHNKDALAQLTAAGFEDVRFHTDAVGSHMDRRIDEDDAVLAKAFAIQAHSSGYSAWFKLLLFSQRWYFVATLLMLVVTFLLQWWVSFSVMAAFLVSTVLFSLYRFGSSVAYHRLMNAYVYGRWSEFPALLKKLKQSGDEPELVIEHDVYLAKFCVAQGDFDQAVTLIDGHKLGFMAAQPGLYESRLSVLYAQAGDVEQHLALMRQSKALAGDSALMVLDWACCELKYGDVASVLPFVDLIEAEPFSEFAAAARVYFFALLALKQGDEGCLVLFEQALSGLAAFENLPLTGLFINEAQVYQAFALDEFGDSSLAFEVAQGSWPLCQLHGFAHERSRLQGILAA